MSKGGADDYNHEATRAIRIISVVVTPVLALYATLIIAGVITSTHYVNAPITLAISIAWVLMSLFYYFIPSADLR